MSPTPTAGIVLLQDDRVLLVKHHGTASHPEGSYGLPAGRVRVDDGETVDEAAVRECREETGLVVQLSEIHQLPTVYHAILTGKEHEQRDMTYTVFVATEFEGELKVSTETEPIWVPLAELGNYNLLPNVEHAVQEAQELVKQLPQ